MTEGKRFSKESFIYVFGEALSKSLTFILLPVYARYLSVEELGILFMVTALWPVILVLLGQGFAGFIIRGYYEHRDKKRFTGTILVFSTTVALGFTFCFHISGPFIFDSLFKNLTYEPYLQYSVFFAVFRLYLTHILSIFRAKRQAKTSVFLSFVLLLTILICVLIAIFFLQADLLGILNAQLVAYILATIIYTFTVLPEISLKFDYSVILPGVYFVLPLVPHALSVWSVNYISRIFVERYMSLTDLSIFTVAMQLALILSVLNNGINQAWIPFVYANYEKQGFTELFSVGAKKVLLLILLAATSLILFSRELLLIMGKSEYLLAENLLSLLLLSYVAQIFYFIHIAVIIYNKQTKLMPFISISSGLFSVVLNILLIPRLGMYGAAISMVLSFALMAFIAYFFSRSYIRVHLFDRRILAWLALTILILGGLFVVFDQSDFWTQIAVKLVVFGVLIISLVRLRLLNLQNIRELLRSL